MEQTLLDHTEHLVEDRGERDLLYELLLKRGVDLTVPIHVTCRRQSHNAEMVVSIRGEVQGKEKTPTSAAEGKGFFYM